MTLLRATRHHVFYVVVADEVQEQRLTRGRQRGRLAQDFSNSDSRSGVRPARQR